MLQGLRTAIYKVNDLAAAREWYCKVLETDPYFDEPFYIGFNVGGYELGLMPEAPTIVPPARDTPTIDAPIIDAPAVDAESGTSLKPESVLTYWGVEDAIAAFDRLLDLGATIHQTVTDVGDGILVATVCDPFGNIFGVIQNPHFSLK